MQLNKTNRSTALIIISLNKR